MVFLGACIVGAVAFASPRSAAPPRGDERVREKFPQTAFMSACENREPEIWFTTVHPVTACADGSQRYPSGLTGSAVDLNRDGVAECFVIESGIDLTAANLPIMWHQEVGVSNGITAFSHRPVLLSESLRQYVLAKFPNATNASTYPPTWRDIDQDGDIDIVLSFYLTVAPGEPGEFETVWIENTGLPVAPATNRYDLDRDGHVNTADLSLLLLEFTD